MLVLIVIVGSVLVLRVSEGTAAESHEPPFEQSGHIQAQNAPIDSHQRHKEATNQKHVGGSPYSLFTHHTAGYFVFAIGILITIDRATHSRQRLLQYAIGAMWTLFGLFIFLRADPEGWPMGSGFCESWTMPTHTEWLQHKFLSLIPLLLALRAFRGRHLTGQNSRESYVTAGLAVIGAVGLLSHQHLDHPGLNVVNLEHQVFAGTCLLIAFSLLQEARGRWVETGKRLIFPTLLILLSLQLIWYIE